MASIVSVLRSYICRIRELRPSTSIFLCNMNVVTVPNDIVCSHLIPRHHRVLLAPQESMVLMVFPDREGLKDLPWVTHHTHTHTHTHTHFFMVNYPAGNSVVAAAKQRGRINCLNLKLSELHKTAVNSTILILTSLLPSQGIPGPIGPQGPPGEVGDPGSIVR